MAAERQVQRKHHKVQRLPKSLRDEISRQLDGGSTYKEIEDWLKSRGHDVGHSSIHRWHTDVKKATERVQMVREQVSTLVNQLRENPQTELLEVATELMTSGAVEAIAKGIDFEGVSPIKMGHMVADLQRSAVARERLKLQFRERAEKALARIAARTEKQPGAKKAIDPETMRIIREEIYGLAPS